MKHILALITFLFSLIVVDAQLAPVRCPMCPPGMECYLGRCVPCSTFQRPLYPMGGYVRPARPVYVRPVQPMGFVHARPPIVVSPPPIVPPPPAPVVPVTINTPRTPFAGPIGVPPGPIGPPLNTPPLGQNGIPPGPGVGIPPTCAPGFRFINNQCIRSAATSSKPLNIVTIGILIIFPYFF